MGQRIIKFSDLSGKEIEDPKMEATITIEFADKRRGRFVLDVTQDEANELADKGTKVTTVVEAAAEAIRPARRTRRSAAAAEA